jgi:hypothetical protein
MKAKYFLAVMLFITGCKKETSGLVSNVQGTWELVSSDGAWTGHHDYEPGNGNTIIFSGNTYSQKIKATDTTYQYSGTFTIYRGKPCDLANEQTLIKFNNNEDASSFSLLDGKLTIGSTECIADGGSSTYKKIQ